MIHSTEQGLKLQLLAVALIVALVFVHYLLWLDENGVRQTHTLRISIQAQTEENAELAEDNRARAAEIEDLKRGLMAIEERARSEIGMVRPDETFYRLLEKPLSQPATPKESTPPTKPAPVAKSPMQAIKPASPAKSPAPAPKTTPPAKHRTPDAKPASPAKSPAPAPKTTPPAKHRTPDAKPASPVKHRTPDAKPAPSAKPLAPVPKTAPPTKPQAPPKPASIPGASQRRE